MRALLFFSFLVASFAVKTLVLFDDASLKLTHSAFFDSLTSRGHELTFKHANEEDYKLGAYGEWYYDNLILFCPTAEDLGDINNFASFIDSGRSVLIAVDEHLQEPLRALVNEVGLDFDESPSQVVDHSNFDVALDEEEDGLHTVVALKPAISAPVMLGKTSGPVLFRGVGHAASDSPLIVRVLTGASTTFSADPKKPVRESPQNAGRDTLLVSAVQTRNNGRVVVSGSLDLFSNKFFFSGVNAAKKAAKSGNEEFAGELSRWVFKERGLLRARELRHHRKGESHKPDNYRIKDEIEFSIIIEEYDGTTQSWVPFKANDVQLEFVMLDPYVRKTLQHDGKGLFSLSFRAPDVYGVFKFSIAYHRLGYSNLEVSEVVPVHPFRHNEYERFIPMAYPYYVASFSLMAGFFVFSIVFLSTKDDK